MLPVPQVIALAGPTPVLFTQQQEITADPGGDKISSLPEQFPQRIVLSSVSWPEQWMPSAQLLEIVQPRIMADPQLTAPVQLLKLPQIVQSVRSTLPQFNPPIP